MAQKIVSFEVAKALKEAGYPQDYNNAIYSEDGHIHVNITYEYRLYVKEHKLGYDTPTYIDAWLWLWREKGWFLKIIPSGKVEFHFQILQYDKVYEEWHSGGVASLSCFQDPEEAIAKAIEYLVENNLIK